MIEQEKTMDMILGNSNERYFGDVFRTFYLQILSLTTVSETELSGEFCVDYLGPLRPRGEAPHLGSIEYLAFALRLATYGLNRLGRLSIADTNRAFVRSYELHSKESLGMGIQTFHCRMLHSEYDMQSMQGSTSLFEIILGNTRIRIELDHRGGMRYRKLPEAETLCWDLEQLHSIGYKCTDMEVVPLEMDLQQQEITARVRNRYLFPENSLHGIGSARDALLATDATRIFGQLMQVLLYELEGSDRQQCANIWLRKMQLQSERPLFTGKARAKVTFDHIREIQKGDTYWKLVSLSGAVGNFTGKFEVAYQVIR